MVALRYAVAVNSLDSLALTKLDVLTGLPPSASAWLQDRWQDPRKPAASPGGVRQSDPVYEELPGGRKISGVRVAWLIS